MESRIRCGWCEKDDLYRRYHDEEWGVPSYCDEHLFEHLILETFQAGLSWHTILSKRENFRTAFDGFDAAKIAVYSEDKVAELLNNPGIIRSNAKIRAAIHNAGLYLKIREEFNGFHHYVWQFTGHRVLKNAFNELRELPAKTAESDAMAADMRKRGFKFVGSTTCYAYMQSVGMVNDHLTTCWLYKNDPEK